MDSFFIKLLLDEIKGRVKKSTFIVSIIGVGILMFDISASLLVPLFQRAWIGPYAYRCFYGGRRYIKADQRKKGRTKAARHGFKTQTYLIQDGALTLSINTYRKLTRTSGKRSY